MSEPETQEPQETATADTKKEKVSGDMTHGG